MSVRDGALWIREGWLGDTIMPQGLLGYLNPARLFLARPKDQTDALAVAEEALKDGALPVVILEITRALNLREGRRLQLAAKVGGTTGLCLIPEGMGSNAAETRWHVAADAAGNPMGWRDVQNVLLHSASLTGSAYGGPATGQEDGVWFSTGTENFNGGGHIAKMLKAIHAQESRKAAAEKMTTVIAELRAMKLTRAAELLDESGHETLTYYGFPDSHWIKLKTNNPLERIMREIRRRTRVVGAFPDGKSCLNLAAARLRHVAGTHWSTRKYMNMTPLFADQTQGAVVA
ncbi:mutator family transposase [Rhodovulum bhavnagarense]|uniref:Mutator family transposase n=1 Tax=Rhodovulum bhavnagarense TaxID=992286 RepID=A0A4V6NRK6_9RHOB|nr:mutator family transposase [Rhodovulum bhavnagarense]